MIHYILTQVPFLFELYADRWLIHKGKKDVPSWVRAVLIVLFSFDYRIEDWIIYCSFHSDENMRWVALSIAPFMFFDYALNKLRGKRWDYSGKTKAYDRELAKYNPVALLVGRIILAAGLLVYWYNVTFNR